MNSKARAEPAVSLTSARRPLSSQACALHATREGVGAPDTCRPAHPTWPGGWRWVQPWPSGSATTHICSLSDSAIKEHTEVRKGRESDS